MATYRWTASYWDGRTSRTANSTITVPANTTHDEIRTQALNTLRRTAQVDMVFTFIATPTSA